MTKINNKLAYPYDKNVTDNDYLVGTDGDHLGLLTRSYKLSDIASYIQKKIIIEEVEFDQNNIVKVIQIPDGEIESFTEKNIADWVNANGLIVADDEIVLFTSEATGEVILPPPPCTNCIDKDSPLNLSVTNVTETSATASYLNQDTAIVRYVISYRNVTIAGPLNQVETTQQAIQITNLSPNTSYDVYVTAYDVYGSSKVSSTVRVTTDSVPVANFPKASLTLVSKGENNANFTWAIDKTNYTPTRYEVFRGLTKIGDVAEGQTQEFSATGLLESTSYDFTVKTYFEENNVTTSDPLNVVTDASPVTVYTPTLTASNITVTTVDLSWSIDVAFNGATYELYREAEGTNPVLSSGAFVDGGSFTVEGLSFETTYADEFYVIIYDGSGNASQRGYVTFTTLPVSEAEPLGTALLNVTILEDTSERSKVTYNDVEFTFDLGTPEKNDRVDYWELYLRLPRVSPDYDVYRINPAPSGGINSKIITNLQDGQTYQAYIVAYDEDTTPTAISDITQASQKTFTIPQPKVMVFLQDVMYMTQAQASRASYMPLPTTTSAIGYNAGNMAWRVDLMNHTQTSSRFKFDVTATTVNSPVNVPAVTLVYLGSAGNVEGYSVVRADGQVNSFERISNPTDGSKTIYVLPPEVPDGNQYVVQITLTEVASPQVIDIENNTVTSTPFFSGEIVF